MASLTFGVRWLLWGSHHLWAVIATAIRSRLTQTRLRLLGAKVGAGLRVRGYLRLRMHHTGRLSIGSHCRIKSGWNENPVAGHAFTLLWVGRDGHLEIGSCVGISNATIVATSNVRVGDDTFIGGGCRIYDTDFHPLDPEARASHRHDATKRRAVLIGSRVFVGGHSIVLKGVTIGDDAVVAAGSVVTCDVPAGEVWGGNPARRIRPAVCPVTVSSR